MSPEEIKQEIEDRITASNTSIDLSKFVSPKLGYQLMVLGREFNLKPEVFLCCLLTAMSGLYKVGTELTLWRSTGFQVSPNLFVAIVAESSLNKSPIIKNIISDPFKKLLKKTRKEYEQANKEYKEAKKEYNQKLARYKSLTKEDRLNEFVEGFPKTPKERKHLLNEATGKSIYSQFENFPNQGMLYLVDDLAGLFESLNQSGRWKHSYKADLLTFNNGCGITKLDSKGVTEVNKTLLSIFGFIQPEVLRKIINDPWELDGRKWPRLLFVSLPLVEETVGERGEEILGDLIEDIYLRIDELPEMQFYLDSEAESLFSKYYDQLEEKRISHPNPATRAIISKTGARIGKLAINLHCLNSIVEEKEIEATIGKETLAAAAKLALWFAQQTIYTISLL